MKILEFNTIKQYEYENGFYLTSTPDRIGKIVSHFTLYSMIKDIPGDIVETGVFKGASFIRWLTFRNLLENENSRCAIGFDSFDSFPETTYEDDRRYREKFINGAGDKSIPIKELEKVLEYKNLKNYKLVKGNILKITNILK